MSNYQEEIDKENFREAAHDIAGKLGFVMSVVAMVLLFIYWPIK